MTRKVAVWIAMFAALFLTRWVLAPKYLFYIDNVNFALSIADFQPLLHQPHPPGDPLFVLLLKVLHVFIPDIKYVELLAGAVGSLATLLAVNYLGNEVFGAPAGAFAVAVMFFVPAFWLAGIGNQVRVFIAAGSAAVALTAWRAMRSTAGPLALPACAATLGVAAGFRPELLLLLFPLLCLAGHRGSRRPVTAMVALGTLGAVTSLWLGVLIWKVGGPGGLAQLFQTQWRSGAAHTSILAGSAMHENFTTALLATYWVGVSALCWAGALVPLWQKLPQHRLIFLVSDRRFLFFALWFVPPYLFHAIIFIHDPDTALDCMTALAVLGGGVLAYGTRGQPRGRTHAVAAAVIAVNVTLFYLSPLHQGRDASYAWVHLVGSDSTRALDTIAQAPRDRPTVVILDHALVTSRQIAYYFPQATILDLDLSKNCPAVQFPSGPDRIIWVARFDAHRQVPAPFLSQPFFSQHNANIFSGDLIRGAHFQIGNCTYSG